jgi:predicted porin
MKALIISKNQILCIGFFICFQVDASSHFYTRVAIDSRSISTVNNGTKTDIASNESKFGLKGKLLLDQASKTKFIFQIEYGFDPLDGKARGQDGTFEQRNTFIGLENNLGTLFAGTHDSALKNSQLNIDLFNDLAPDIKHILHGENRLEDFIGYTTPRFQGEFSATINSIKNPFLSGKRYKSYSVNYSGDNFQAAFALDEAMKGYDSSRLSFLYPFKNSKLGLILQKTTKLSSGDDESGEVVSFAKKFKSKGTFKIQYASSSMKVKSGKHATIGYDHQLRNNLKLFTYYSMMNSKTNRKDKNIFSLGFECNL